MIKTICVDFDGVIHDNLSYKSSSIINGNIIKGAKESLELLSREYKVVIHSARFEDDSAIDAVRTWLLEHGMVYELSKLKPHATMYIDDRAIPFNGSWDKTIDKVKDFKQWQQDTKDKSKAIRKTTKRLGAGVPMIKK